MQMNGRQPRQGRKHSTMLLLYDLALLITTNVLMLVVYPSGTAPLSWMDIGMHMLLNVLLITFSRVLGGIYRQIWRYGGTSQYMRLILSDAVGCIVYLLLMAVLPLERIAALRAFSIVALNLLAAISIRLIYQHM